MKESRIMNDYEKANSIRSFLIKFTDNELKKEKKNEVFFRKNGNLDLDSEFKIEFKEEFSSFCSDKFEYMLSIGMIGTSKSTQNETPTTLPNTLKSEGSSLIDSLMKSESAIIKENVRELKKICNDLKFMKPIKESREEKKRTKSVLIQKKNNKNLEMMIMSHLKIKRRKRKLFTK